MDRAPARSRAMKYHPQFALQSPQNRPLLGANATVAVFAE